MKKIIAASFMILLNISIAEAYIGSKDNRVNVDNWDTPPYNQIVKIGDDCTGQFVSPIHILTAAHCINGKSSRPTIHKSNGSKTSAKTLLLGYEDKDKTIVDKDYALLEIPEEYKSPAYFKIADVTSASFVNLAGFGNLRILEDDELIIIRKKFVRILRQKVKPTSIEEKFPELRTDERLLENHNLDEYARLLEKALAKDDEDGRAIPKIFGDSDKLKVHIDCRLQRSKELMDVFESNCDGFGGNSGGALYINNEIHGIASVSNKTISAKDRNDGLLSPDTGKFYKAVQDIIILSLPK
ncbi:MAG: S1 family peptidase [Alphaproteobacteria bacterium]|nr:S1 family peptidase [Alphaproteobacteria bacterium]